MFTLDTLPFLLHSFSFLLWFSCNHSHCCIFYSFCIVHCTALASIDAHTQMQHYLVIRRLRRWLCDSEFESKMHAHIYIFDVRVHLTVFYNVLRLFFAVVVRFFLVLFEFLNLIYVSPFSIMCIHARAPKNICGYNAVEHLVGWLAGSLDRCALCDATNFAVCVCATDAIWFRCLCNQSICPAHFTGDGRGSRWAGGVWAWTNVVTAFEK